MAKINQKYFGNRNIGTTGTSDDRIGGEGIASINWSTLGSFQGNSNVQVLTALTALPAPTLPGGVQATYTAQFEVESVGTGSGKTNLAVGDTFGVASIPGMIAKVASISGANAVWSVTTTGASRGNALALSAIPQDTVGITLTKIAGSGTASTFLVDIAFQVKESTVTITEKGSGYVGTETFTFTKPGTTNGTVPAGTIVLTTDSGAPGSETNQENAITVFAKTTDATTTAQVADIIKQRSTKRFKVKTANGTAICELKSSALSSSASTDTNKMTITATDSVGGTYFVTKIGARRCTVTRGTGTQFASDSSVPWTFGSAVLNTSVKIANA
jgi:hypothetical protein